MKIKLGYLLPLLLIANLAEAQNGIYIATEGGIALVNGLPSPANAGAIRFERSAFPYVIRGSFGYNHDFNSLFGIGFEMGLSQFSKTTYYYSNVPNTELF